MTTNPYEPPQTAADIVVAQVVEEPRKKPWGFWATGGLSLLIGGAFVGAQTVVAIVAVVAGMATHPPSTGTDLTEVIDVGSGWLMAAATWASFPVCLGLIAIAVKLRRGWSIREYLALESVSPGKAAMWLVLVPVFAAATDTFTWLLGRPIVSDVMLHAYRTAYWLPLLWAAFLIAAPVFEETFMRGFMFRGLQASRLGNAGAILITSLIFALLHLQYDWYGMLMCGLIGLLLGTARAATGSTLVPIAMHSLSNLIATVEAHLLS